MNNTFCSGVCNFGTRIRSDCWVVNERAVEMILQITDVLFEKSNCTLDELRVELDVGGSSCECAQCTVRPSYFFLWLSIIDFVSDHEFDLLDCGKSYMYISDEHLGDCKYGVEECVTSSSHSISQDRSIAEDSIQFNTLRETG